MQRYRNNSEILVPTIILRVLFPERLHLGTSTDLIQIVGRYINYCETDLIEPDLAKLCQIFIAPNKCSN